MIPLSSTKKGNHPDIRKINIIKQLAVPNWCLELNSREMVKLQERDQDLSLVRAWLTKDKQVLQREVAMSSAGSKHFWQIRAKLSIKNDILMLEGMNGPVLVVPEQMKHSIMEACHGSVTAGHLGATKMVSNLRKSFHWYAMTSQCHTFVKCCNICQRYKGPNKKRRFISCWCSFRTGTY